MPASPLDADTDGVCNGGNQVGTRTAVGPDNCPFVEPGDQTNSDALRAGDICQCGNLDEDGVLNAADTGCAPPSVLPTAT